MSLLKSLLMKTDRAIFPLVQDQYAKALEKECVNCCETLLDMGSAIDREAGDDMGRRHDLRGVEGKEIFYKKMKEAWKMKADWDRKVLNPQGGSPSGRIYRDLVSKIRNGYFKESRSFEKLKGNQFVKDSYVRE